MNNSKLKRAKRYVIVGGYLRGIQSNLARNISLNDIIQICCLFYSNSFKIFIALSARNKTRVSLRNLYVLDFDVDKLSTLKQTEPSKSIHSKHCLFTPCCYIKNISSKLNIPQGNKLNINSSKYIYNAIFCAQNDHPSLLIFASNTMDDDTVTFCKITSNQTLPQFVAPQEFIHCNQNGIICEDQGYLYQLKLDNINVENPDFNFNIIAGSNKSIQPSKHLSMYYLSDMDKIFSIHNYMVTKKTNCAIYDCIDTKWKPIAKSKIEDRRYTICRNLCDNVLYAVSNSGQITRYDFEKNKWKILSNGGLYLLQSRQHVAWMENTNMIYCSDGDDFAYFDVRDDKRKWYKMNNYWRILNKALGCYSSLSRIPFL